ncbi:GMP synthase (glutamine-hydrolyzing) [Toensbergia leucococca]|nr:GMP synthase (glutamine-hydrolyzing) [Toensbergia leucococca]
MHVNGETTAEPHQVFDTILVSVFALVRRLREINVYSEMLACTQKIAQLSWKPRGIILSGGPYSVYEEHAPHVDPAVFDLDVPILGICYGLQEIAWHHGRNVLAGEKKEYGNAIVNVQHLEDKNSHVNKLLHGLGNNLKVWMSHGDKLSHLPASFSTIATTENAPYAGIVHVEKPCFGIQFHPEVTHTPDGTNVLRNFAVNICKASQNWTMEEFVSKEISRIRALVGEKGQVVGAVSGGVDSTVAAKLMHEAIGDRFHAVLVNNGLLRLNEAESVHQTLTRHLGINLTVVDASDRFLADLKGVLDPEKKRKTIGRNFIEVFQETAKRIAADAAGSPQAGGIEWLLQGTLYPDVIESISFKGPSASIKSHHNVGGLPAVMHLKLIEPLRELFKDEVRELGTSLGLPEELVWRQPFPGPGLGVRVVGIEVNRSTCRIVQEADAIFIEEIRKAGLYRKISQAYASLLGVPVVGVTGDKRVHACPVVLRAVTTTDYMTADWFSFDSEFFAKVSTRITNEVDGVCRVFYDSKNPPAFTGKRVDRIIVTSKPPGTIEME